jgi:SAM-dependent methyltransferase
MADEPRAGDAYGELLRAALAEETGQGPRPTVAGRYPRPVIEIVERDDGLVNGAPAARYLAGPAGWPDCERRALDRIRGRVLDVGAGGGRVALAVQDRGAAVTGLDISPGAAEVAAARGVRSVVCATVDDHLTSGARYDTFVLFGNNVGLLGSRERAPRFLATLAGLARPGARIVAQGTDPYGTTDPVHLRYHERNRARGRLAGQLTVRVRYLDLATPWFDYLFCSIDELRELLAGTAWRLAEVDDGDPPLYVATLALTG